MVPTCSEHCTWTSGQASLYIMTEPQANDYSSFTSIFTDDMYIYFFRQSQL